MKFTKLMELAALGASLAESDSEVCWLYTQEGADNSVELSVIADDRFAWPDSPMRFNCCPGDWVFAGFRVKNEFGYVDVEVDDEDDSFVVTAQYNIDEGGFYQKHFKNLAAAKRAATGMAYA